MLYCPLSSISNTIPIFINSSFFKGYIKEVIATTIPMIMSAVPISPPINAPIIIKRIPTTKFSRRSLIYNLRYNNKIIFVNNILYI